MRHNACTLRASLQKGHELSKSRSMDLGATDCTDTFVAVAATAAGKMAVSVRALATQVRREAAPDKVVVAVDIVAAVGTLVAAFVEEAAASELDLEKLRYSQAGAA